MIDLRKNVTRLASGVADSSEAVHAHAGDSETPADEVQGARFSSPVKSFQSAFTHRAAPPQVILLMARLTITGKEASVVLVGSEVL